ncbi:MAG: hypothetical protein IPO62_04660 [Saprospiraceae bacterium]|nr:hypothetical protein [Saprospiraceae bacterium]
MRAIHLVYTLIFISFSVLSSIGQSNDQYLKKSDGFIRDFLSNLNNIYDTTLATQENKKRYFNFVLDNMIESRDSTILYDNLSMQLIRNNRVNAQKYMENYRDILQARLNVLPTKYTVKNTMMGFKEDTLYVDQTGQHLICKLSRIIEIDFVNSNKIKKYRSDTISFYIKFLNKDLYERRIISSDRYITNREDSIKILDTDRDGIPDDQDACWLIPGVDYCEGCRDTDGDRICDKMDECPKEPGVEYCKGCPDSDKDGICDKVDKCPTEEGPISNNGCPVTAKPVIPEILNLPIITLPVTLDLQNYQSSKSDYQELELNSDYISNLNPSKFRNFNGTEILRLSLKIQPNKNRLIKTNSVEIKLWEINFNAGNVISLNPVIFSAELPTTQDTLLALFKLDLSEQKQLAKYLTTL